MSQNNGCFKTATGKMAKWSRYMIPCLPTHDEDFQGIELKQETVNQLYSVLEHDLNPLLTHIRSVIVYQRANYENGFFTEPTGIIDGSGLPAWLMINMEIPEIDDARYTSKLLSGHETLFTIVNHYMIEARVGHFRRYPTPNNRNDRTIAANDFLFACFLCEKIGASWKDFPSNLSQWEFVYVPPDVEIQPQLGELNDVKSWSPSIWAGPLIKMLNNPRETNARDMPDNDPQ